MQKINALEKCITELQQFQGVGYKTAMRYALQILQMDRRSVGTLANAILELKDIVKFCRICGGFAESEVCHICSDEKRNHNTICIVEEPKDILTIENIGRYNGLYHVVGGKISPLNGVTPDKLRINELILRIKENVTTGKNSTSDTLNENEDSSGGIELSPEITLELIMALSSDVESETTVFFITKKIRELTLQEKLTDSRITISRIASGVAVGSSLEYTDDLTLMRALDGRTKI